MKKLTISRRIMFALFAVLVSVNLWGQTRTGLTGSGTSESPWQIGSAADWTEFATHTSYWSGYVKLTSNIPNAEDIAGGTTYVSEMLYAGGGYTAFSGNFDGDNKTLTFGYTSADEYDTGIAPFYYLDGATVSNLTIDGTINAKGGMVAGLAFYNYSGNINKVTIGLDIIAEEQYWCGGFAYESDGENYTNCIYNGKIVAGAQSCGFTVTVAYDGGKPVFNNCLFDPEEGSSIKSGKVFGDGSNFSTCYYTDNLGITSQGTKVYYNPTDFVGKKVSAFPDYYTPVNVVVSGVNLTYDYNNETNYYTDIISVVTVTSDDPSLTYSVSIHDKDGVTETVTDKGDYAVVVTGTGNYTGLFKKYFYVVGDIELQDQELPYNATTNPYVITSAADWIKLSDNVSNDIDADKSYKLTANISVSDIMVGTSAHPFSGSFNGQIGSSYGAYTLTFNYGTSADPTEDEIVAPFRYTDGATFESLIVAGDIYTNVGKESGLIGVNTRTSTNTIVRYVVNNVNFHCAEDLLNSEGGGYAYKGSGISFSYCSYEGMISANNYHGGFCGNADVTTTTFSNCLFDPDKNGSYWAQNFIFNTTGELPNNYYNTCYYTVGPNQEESDQGTMVFVNSVPEGNIGHKLTTFHEKVVYEPVTVVISGVNKRYTWTGNEITVAPTAVTFDGNNALVEDHEFCTWSISPSPVQAVGKYTFTLTAPNPYVTSDYLGTINQIVRVVKSSSTTWSAMQVALNSSASEITIDLNDIISEQDDHVLSAGTGDACLVIEGTKTVTINLQDNTIDRGFYEGNDTWETPVIGGQVLKIASGTNVIINGPGTIKGGCNKASTTNEHAENSDGGGIFNMGNLTLNNVTVEGNYCEKKSAGVSRTARGGGIYSGSGSKLIINNCTITHNEAKGGGGGLFAEKAAVFEMKNTSVRSNQSQDKGGGIRINADGTTHNDAKTLVGGALIDNCVIENNTVELHNSESASNGGGIHLDAGTLYLTNSTVRQNYASKFGGGIYMMGGTLNASGCQFLYNRSYDAAALFEGCGGGVCLLGGTFKMVGGTITGNSSYVSDGGGIYVASGKTLKLEGSVNIYDNWAYDDASIETKHTTNVYLAGENDKITISGSIAEASVGVSKKGNTGVFTTGLSGYGSVANFISDNEDYEVVPSSGNAKLAKIEPVTPPVSGVWTITEAVILAETVDDDVTSIVFGTDGCLFVNEGGFIGSSTTITNSDPNKLIINGGQVYTTSPNVKATMKKDIKAAYAMSQQNWYILSSPLNNPEGSEPVVYNPISITSNTNLIKLSGNNFPEYDLYRFNEAVVLQWENYRSTEIVHSGFNPGDAASALQHGRGYLYRNTNDYTVNMVGTLNAGSVGYALSCTSTVAEKDNPLKGFNIIGNPYSHNIYKGAAESAIPNGDLLEGKYYVLNLENEDHEDKPSGMWHLTDDGTAIPPMAGIMVQAKAAGTLEMTNSMDGYVAPSSKSAENNNIWFTVANNKYEDRTCVEFRKGHGLNKIGHLNEEAPMLYVNYKGENFGSVDMNPEAKSFNLYFEAKKTGMFTLSVDPQGEYEYLHLIDKLAGRDIDLLLENEYTFVGSVADSKDRFVIALDPSYSTGSENDAFAYQSGDEIVVDGDGELQIFDLMGRMIASQRVSGVEMVSKPSSSGVYIMRLNDKTQKIVVR